MKAIIIALLLLAVTSSFAAPQTQDSQTSDSSPTSSIWSAQRLQHELCGDDSWEPFNRTMFGIFDGLMEYVVDPFCYLYSSIIPKPAIGAIDNFTENIEYPVRLVSDLFMGEWDLAWFATKRFCVNTTVGIGGLLDPAEDWLSIPDDNSSLSDAFTAWGIPAGPQLALPFSPRSSVRGHIGYVLDYGLDPKFWFDFFMPSKIYIGYSWCLTPNKAPVWRGSWESMFYHADDHYAYYMPLMSTLGEFNLKQKLAHYNEEIRDTKGNPTDLRPSIVPAPKRPVWVKGRWLDIPGYDSRSPAIDSIRALCFSPVGDKDFWWERRSIFNRDFSKQVEERSIVIDESLSKATYSFVPAPKLTDLSSERLVIILPGIGAGRTSSDTVAMIELLNTNGYAVVASDSIFHYEHVRSVNRHIMPGNIAEDVRRYGEYLAKVLEDLRKSGKICNPEVSVIGWSMGGLSVVHLAAIDDQDKLPFKVSHFVAINPPASLKHVIAPVNAIMEKSRTWTKEYALAQFGQVACELYGWALQDHPRYDPANPQLDKFGRKWVYSPNLSDEQASYLLAQTILTPFRSIVAQRHAKYPFPWIKSPYTWFHRDAFYNEIGDLSIPEYFERYLAFCYPEIEPTEIISKAEIHGCEHALSHNRKLTAIHTWTDPLVTEEDRRYLDGVMRDRITWFSEGSHCGYFYTKPFQDELLRQLQANSCNNIDLQPGTYHFYESDTTKMVLNPSNNQSGEKQVVFPLVSKNNLTIDGHGSRLVFHGQTFPFAATNCRNLVFRNFEVTTAYPSCAGFTVLEKDATGFLLQFEEGVCPFVVTNRNLVFSLDSHAISTADGRLSLHSLERIAIHYLMTPNSPGNKDNFPSTFVGVVPENCGNGKVRFSYYGDKHPKSIAIPYNIGERVVINLEERRYREVFFLEDCENVRLENITISRFGGMGVVAQRSGNITVDGMNAQPIGNEKVSLTADILQFINCYGKVEVLNCKGGYSLDDWINIHGNYLMVEKVDGNIIHLRAKHPSHFGFFPYRIGDEVEIVTAHERKLLAKAKIVKFEQIEESSSVSAPVPASSCTLTLDIDIPSSVTAGCLLENTTLNPNVTIANNYFHDYPNLRLSGRGRYLVENNRFERGCTAVTGFDLADYWMESGRISEMLIRNNEVVDSGAFIFGISGWNGNEQDVPLIHGHIRLENNRFERVRGANFSAVGVQRFEPAN